MFIISEFSEPLRHNVREIDRNSNFVDYQNMCSILMKSSMFPCMFICLFFCC